MSFLLDNKYEISSKSIRNLITFSTQANSVPMENTFFYWYLDNFLFINDLSSETGFAFSSFWSYLSFSFTGIAILLNLLVHSWSHLIHLYYKKDTWTTRPFPLHVEHFSTFYPPFPLQVSQHLVLSCGILRTAPLYACYRVTSSAFFVALTFCCSLRAGPREPPPKNMFIRSLPSDWGPFVPNLS